MVFDEGLAQRLRETYAQRTAAVEKKMFGGLAFMVNGHMSCGVSGNDLMCRVGPDGYESALQQPHARKMDFTGRPLKGFVYVASEGVADDRDLQAWVGRSLEFVQKLPPK